MAVKKRFHSFQDLLHGSDLPLLVDFYAHWCGPCKIVASTLEQVNDSLHDRLRVVKIDTDKYPQIASQYQVRALPTLILFRDGRPLQRFEGAVSAPDLLQVLQQLL